MDGTIRFDGVEIDRAAHVIRSDGAVVHVEPQVFGVLSYLVEHRDRLVTKFELLDNVWGDRFVSESALTSRIKAARRAVGDDGRTQAVIRTLHGRGYQFVADVDELGDRTQRRDARSAALRAPVGMELIGRSVELADLTAALDVDRLVTVVGPGGVGKTRLAVEVARAWEDDGHSVDIVELDSVTTPTGVPQQICDTLGIRADGDVDPIAVASEILDGPSRLLVLDNFEHVLDAAPDVARLGRLAPDLRILVTSRERLRLSDERVLTIEPLRVSGDVDHAPAVMLFEALAQRLDQRFAVDGANAPLVTEICQLVDGLPLGLDLAAAQLAYMPLDYVRTHLERNAAGIGHGVRDRPQRQQTVSDLIGWSYHQLDADGQRLLRSLSVFRGGVPLSGLRSVGGYATDVEALQGVARLADASLVRVEPASSEPRYGLLNVIRSFAAEQLESSGDAATVRWAHAAWVGAMVAASEHAHWDRNVADGWADLGREYANISAALEHLAEQGDHTTLARIVADSNLWWYRSGRHSEARRWVGVALDGAGELDPRPAGRLHFVAGLLAFTDRDIAGAVEHYQRAMDYSSRAGDWRYEQLATSNHALRALNDPDEVGTAVAELEAVVEVATARNEPAVLAHALNILGVLLHRTGRADEARKVHRRGVELNRKVGDRFYEALNHANLGHIDVEAGRPESALVAFDTALTISSRIGASVLSAWMLSEIASAKVPLGDAEEAAVLLGASDAHLDAIGAHRGPAAHQSWHESTVERLHEVLGADEFERLHAIGAELPIRDAIERVLSS